ncbi:MAG: amino-acid N-acetyltransferase, partial [Natronospirillum sp.]
MSVSSDQFLQFFRGTSPYIHAHRGKTLVVYLSGEALENGGRELIHDLALLRSLGLRLVVVFGTRLQVSEAFDREDLPENFHGSLRVTTADSLQTVVAAAQSVLVRLQAEFSTGLVNSPMHGASVRTVSGNYVYAKPQGILDGVDFQYTGAVRSIAGKDICHQLDAGNIVLVPPYGFSVTGELFNLSALEVAQQCAHAVQADKLVIVGNISALPAPEEQGQFTPHELRQHLELMAPESAGYPEFESALLA